MKYTDRELILDTLVTIADPNFWITVRPKSIKWDLFINKMIDNDAPFTDTVVYKSYYEPIRQSLGMPRQRHTSSYITYFLFEEKVVPLWTSNYPYGYASVDRISSWDNYYLPDPHPIAIEMLTQYEPDRTPIPSRRTIRRLKRYIDSRRMYDLELFINGSE